MVRKLLVAAGSLALLGCGGEVPPPPPPPPPGTVVLGTPLSDGTGFAPLEGIQPLAPGSQGGFHVWLKYRVADVAPGKCVVRRTARRAEDQKLVLTTESRVPIGPPTEAGFWELPLAIPSFMCPTPVGVRVRDERVVFTVRIADEAGEVLAEGSAEATPRCPDGDLQAFCEQICSG